MTNDAKSLKQPRRFASDSAGLTLRTTNLIAIGAFIAWTAVSLFVVLIENRAIDSWTLRLARQIGYDNWSKDLLIRRWAAGHGGVYAPQTDSTAPNPYLTGVPERDIESPSGRKLTLLNPAYITRQLYELASTTGSISAHITSLKPIRPENRPDDWETAALLAFERGVNETLSVESDSSGRSLRLMRPFITEAPCLKCHSAQGYKVGDVRGGISISVPLNELDLEASAAKREIMLGIFSVWFLGALGIGLSAFTVRRKIRGSLELQRVNQIVYDLERTLTQVERTDAACEAGLDAAISVAGFDSGGVYILEGDSGLNLAHHRGLGKEFIEKYRRRPKGHPWEEMLARTECVILSKERIEQEEGYRREGLAAGAVFPMICNHNVIGCINLASHSNSEFPVRLTKVLLTIANQTAGALVRLDAEKKLRESEALYRTLVESSTEMVLLVQGSRIIFANQAAVRISGYSLEELLGRDFVDLVALDEREKILAVVADSYNNPSGDDGRKLLIHNANGRAVWVETRISPINWNGATALFAVLTDITGKLKAEEELQQTRDRWQALLDASPFGIHLWRLDESEALRFAGANASAEKNLGFDHSGLFDLPILEAFPGLAGTDVPLSYIRCCRDGVSFLREVDYDNAGIKGTFAVHAFQTSPGHMAAMFRDVTEEKRSREALIESERKFQRLTEQLNETIFFTDAFGVITYISPAVKTMFGYGAEDIVGKPISQFLNRADSVGAKRLLERMMRQRSRDFHLEFKFIRRDGSTIHTECAATAIEQDGVNSGYVGAVRDVSARKAVEESLRDHKEFLEETQRVARIGSYRLDITTGIWESSAILDDIFGIGREFSHSVDGWLEIVHPDDREMMSAYFMDEVIGKRMSFDKTYRIRRISNGEERWVHGMGRLECDADGVPVAMIGVIQDVSEAKETDAERQRLEVQLQQAQKMESIGRLAGGVAHDFNNMLMAIMGNAEIALEMADPADAVYWSLQEILKASRRSADLTKQLLAFARKQTITPVTLDLNETVSGMLKMLRRLIGEDITLSWTPGAELWKVMMDPVQIDQILANLVVNSRDAIEGHGNIRLAASNVFLKDDFFPTDGEEAAGAFVMLEVSDDGRGMSEEVVGKIFEPFFTTKEVGKGTGLGLATVYGIVKQSQGHIRVESTIGEGTAFRIYFPRVLEAPVVQVVVPGDRSFPRGKETILLVEDEPSVLYMGKTLLEKLGYRVIPAQSPELALTLVSEFPDSLDMVISDVVMPGMNGAELVSKLREIKPGFTCLFISGYSSDVPDLERLLEEGSEFLQKPFTFAALAERVLKALDGSHSGV